MLTASEIRAHLARAAYKPGFSWELHEDPWEGLYVRFLVDVPDTYGGKPTTLGINSWLPPQVSTESLDLWMVWRLGRIESHECREFYKVGDRPVFDPHQPT